MLRGRRFVLDGVRCFNPKVICPPPWNLEQLRDNWRDPEFPVNELQNFTEHDNHEKRQKMRDLVETDDTFFPGKK